MQKKVPEWLGREENYKSNTDKDPFIDKSVLSLLHIISKIRIQTGYRRETLQVSAVAKVFCTFVLLVLTAISQHLSFVVVVNVYLLCVLSIMKADEILKILKITLGATCFTGMILLPAVFTGNPDSLVMIVPKVTASVTAVNILSQSTGWNSITRAFRTFHIPDIFILVLDIAMKYLLLLGEFSLNLFYSLKLRSVGKNNRKYSSLSGIAGTMFLNSKEMADEMYSAMECRGFNGKYPAQHKYNISFADLLYFLINACLIFTFFYLRKG